MKSQHYTITVAASLMCALLLVGRSFSSEEGCGQRAKTKQPLVGTNAPATCPATNCFNLSCSWIE